MSISSLRRLAEKHGYRVALRGQDVQLVDLSRNWLAHDGDIDSSVEFLNNEAA